MANQEPTKLVLRRMTKSQLVNLGGNMFIYSKRWTWLGAFVFGLAFFLLMSYFDKHTITTNIISITPLAVVLVSFFGADFLVAVLGKVFLLFIFIMASPQHKGQSRQHRSLLA